MQLYRIPESGHPPYLVPLDTQEGPLTRIGIGGTGKREERVVVPVIGTTGQSVEVTPTRNGIALVRGDWPDDGRCVIVVDSRGIYSRYADYDVHEPVNLDIIAVGINAWGGAGRVNPSREIIAIAYPGAEFRLNSKYDTHYYRWDGRSWTMETAAERAARLSSEAAQANKGRWL